MSRPEIYHQEATDPRLRWIAFVRRLNAREMRRRRERLPTAHHLNVSDKTNISQQPPKVVNKPPTIIRAALSRRLVWSPVARNAMPMHTNPSPTTIRYGNITQATKRPTPKLMTIRLSLIAISDRPNAPTASRALTDRPRVGCSVLLGHAAT
jgi:hypothetical protein